MVNTSFSRALGCLAGVAVGDALGRATEFLTREQIRERFGWLDRFEVARPPHPAHADPPGSITDDTTQTLLIAQVVAQGKPLTPARVAAALAAWAREHDGLANPYLGPSTRRALQALLQGVSPEEAGKQGATNGAAMRVAAIGIAHAGDFEGALQDAIASATPTHNTHNGLQGAAAAACAVAEAMTHRATLESILSAAQEGARRGRAYGAWSWATPLEKRIDLAARLVREAPTFDAALQALYDYVGVGLDPAESVAAALGVVAAAGGDPRQAVLGGANLGGDADTIASIAGGICGAWRGIEALDADWVAEVQRVNRLDLAAVAASLVNKL